LWYKSRQLKTTICPPTLLFAPLAQRQIRLGLVFKAHRLVYHSTLGWTVIKKKKKTDERPRPRKVFFVY